MSFIWTRPSSPVFAYCKQSKTGGYSLPVNFLLLKGCVQPWLSWTYQCYSSCYASGRLSRTWLASRAEVTLVPIKVRDESTWWWGRNDVIFYCNTNDVTMCHYALFGTRSCHHKISVSCISNTNSGSSYFSVGTSPTNGQAEKHCTMHQEVTME